MKFQIVKHNGHFTLGVPLDYEKSHPFLVRREGEINPNMWSISGFARSYKKAVRILRKYLIDEWHSNKEEVVLFEIDVPEKENSKL